MRSAGCGRAQLPAGRREDEWDSSQDECGFRIRLGSGLGLGQSGEREESERHKG